MTLTSINEAFCQHRKTCQWCGSSGPALCRIGLELLSLFHDVLVAATLEEVKAEVKAERARA